MVQMFINRAGKKLTAERKKELEKAKSILRREKSAILTVASKKRGIVNPLKKK
jgi:hypothetical protein